MWIPVLSMLQRKSRSGDEITENNVRSVRPGYGLHSKYLPQILGKHFTQDLHKSDRMKLEYVE